MQYDRGYLRKRLTERNSRPERADALDIELWEQLGADQAVLVSDMSGFTRLTRKCGILHFLALHYQGVDLTQPLVEAHRGRLLKTQADNMISAFGDPLDAVRCAVETQKVLRAYNGLQPDPDAHLLFCVGIGFGRMLSLADDVFGDEVNVAYKLGEDIARPYEILVSEAAHTAITAATEEFRFGPLQSERTGNVDLGFYRLDW